MTDPIVSAYLEVCEGWSVDRVIADPELNARFLLACQRRGLLDWPAVELNLHLLNKRKAGDLPRSNRRTCIRNQDSFAFASEMAIRCLERKHRTTLDRVLCDPELAEEFDKLAAAIAPGFPSVDYRWAALRLRKTNRLKPEVLGRVIPSEVCGPIAVAALDFTELPRQPGIYVFLTHSNVLYVGEAKNLRNRLKKHLEHSDRKLLALYMWEFGEEGLLIEYHVLPEGTRTDVRKAMELEMIRSRHPEFNLQR